LPATPELRALQSNGFVGIVAVLLGGVGLVMCVAGVAYTRAAATRLREVTECPQTAVENSLTATEEALAPVEGKLDGRRASTAVVRGTAQCRGEKATDIKDNLAAVFDRLVSVVERADRLAKSLRSISTQLNRSADVAEQLGGSDGNPCRMKEVVEGFVAVCDRLTTIRDEVAEIPGVNGPLSGEMDLGVASQLNEHRDRPSDRVPDVHRLMSDRREDAAEHMQRQDPILGLVRVSRCDRCVGLDRPGATLPASVRSPVPDAPACDLDLKHSWIPPEGWKQYGSPSAGRGHGGQKHAMSGVALWQERIASVPRRSCRTARRDRTIISITIKTTVRRSDRN
jgi:hypothetical protein